MSILQDLGIRDHQNRAKEELVYNISYCYSLIESTITDALKPFGLTPVKMNALIIIKHAGPGWGMSQSELSKRMVVTAGNITRLIDRLQKEGLVERTALSNDRRVNLIKVTNKGSNALDRAWPVYIKAVNDMITIPRASLEGTVKQLDHFRKHLQFAREEAVEDGKSAGGES